MGVIDMLGVWKTRHPLKRWRGLNQMRVELVTRGCRLSSQVGELRELTNCMA